MASKVDIINRAMTKLNAKRITSGQQVGNATHANAVWDTILEEVLSSFAWSFATRRVLLARLSAEPAYGYDYQYRIPSEPKSLRVWDAVNDTGNPVKEWVLEGDDEGLLLLTNYNTIYIRHTVLIIDTERFSAWMLECLATRLASELAYPITGKRKTGQEMLAEYRGKIEIAGQKESLEGLTEVDDEKYPSQDDWVTARHS